MVGRKPGGKKTGGRKCGTKNKTSAELKEFYVSLLSDNTDNIEAALEELYEDSKKDYLMAIDKISNKVVANKKDITSDDKPIQIVSITGVKIIEDGSKELLATKTN